MRLEATRPRGRVQEPGQIQPGGLYRADRVAATAKSFLDLYGRSATRSLASRRGQMTGARQVAVVIFGDPQRPSTCATSTSPATCARATRVFRRSSASSSAWYDAHKDQAVARPGRSSGATSAGQRQDQLEVPGSPDQVDVTITVGKKQTGNITLGVISRPRARSRSMPASNGTTCSGRNLHLDLERSAPAQQSGRRLSTVDPYFTFRRFPAFDIYYQTTTPLNSQGEYYQVVTAGTSVPSACRTATSTPCTTAPATSRPDQQQHPGHAFELPDLHRGSSGATATRCR